VLREITGEAVPPWARTAPGFSGQLAKLANEAEEKHATQNRQDGIGQNMTLGTLCGIPLPTSCGSSFALPNSRP
jgi:hypothetical protein